MLATCSVDKTLTLWDTYNPSTSSPSSPPKSCGSKEMNVGKLYTVNFYPSSPWLVGCGGGGKELAVWDMTREAPIQKRFGGRTTSAPVAVSEEESPSEDKEEAYEAMMSAPAEESTAEATLTKESSSKSKKKKGNGKKKSKAHKAKR